MTQVLEVRALRKSFGGIDAVADVSFDVGVGECVALIGPNGAGKTTCFNMLTGRLRPDRGTVRCGGVDITGWHPRKIWRLGVGRTFQITETFSSMTVRENVQMALLSHHRAIFSLHRSATQSYNAEADHLLKQVDMAAQADRACSELAYGDLKRLELAIALAHGPKLLLMDEPTAGMAPAERAALMGLVATLVQSGNTSVLFTEHDMDVVFAHADRVLVLNRGELIAEGKPDAIRANEMVQAVYLGGGTVFRKGKGAGDSAPVSGPGHA